MEGLRTPAELVMRVIILLAYGCPIQAIVHAYDVDERTVADWQQHYGSAWQGFADAKAKFDPKNILTPGPGIFPKGC